MEIGNNKLLLDGIGRQNKWLKVGLLLSIVLLFVQSYVHSIAEHRVVLVPSVLSPNMMISNKGVSKDYLTYFAKDVVYLLLNVTPETTKSSKKALRRLIHPESFARIAKEFDGYIADIQSKEATLSFSITELDVDIDNLSVDVTGYLRTYVGSKQVSSDLKNYRVAFKHSGALLLLNEFAEVVLDD